MKISQEDGIMIKKISVCQSSMVHEGCWVNFPTTFGNLETSTVCWRESRRRVQPGSSRPRSSCSSGWPCAQSGGQAIKAPIRSWDFAWNFHLLFKCAQDNSLWSPAQALQTTSCSAVVWSQSHLPSLTAKHLIICDKSYCSFINGKLNKK